ncbi:hypothetical protein [Sphingorhabdus sp.]|uniref:hypothetical protein n=1 Tax=Sphingorhabdus sp. TaxID=1902408 RepID=UPI003340FCB2
MSEFLTTLHAKINAVVQIVGLSEDESGAIFDILFVEPPTEEQQAQVDAIVADWPLEKAKLEKLAQVDADWKTTLQAGWTSPAGWKLGIDISDVTLLTGAFMLAKETQAMGLDVPVTITDMPGAAHNLNLAELTGLMLAYGQARAALSSADAARRRAINAATTPEELETL